MAEDKQQAQSAEADEAKAGQTQNQEEEKEKQVEEKKEETPTGEEAPADKPQEKVSAKEEATASGGAPQDAGEVDMSKLSDTAKKVVEMVEGMKILELAELVKVLEEKFGVSAAAPVAAPMAVGAGAGEAGEEKTEFNVVLTETGSNKIGVIKAVREVVQMGLKEAKDLVEGAPKVVKEGVKKAEAEEMKKKLEAAGAKVELQ